MNNIKAWIPLPTPFPILNFPQRAIKKWFFILKNLIVYFCAKFGISGAKAIGVSPSGNNLLRLNRNYALGERGTILEIPRDRVIYEHVKNRGAWELEECKFLAKGLINACQQAPKKTALLDIGANIGLVTLQAMNLSKTNNEVFLFEPVPTHAFAIKQNLKKLDNLHLNEFALSNKNGKSHIFTQESNHGNSSLLQSAVPAYEMTKTQITEVDTSEYCNKFLGEFDRFVIKCDTQGMDALILSRLPKWIWENCVAAVVEVWALPEVNKSDVDGLLSMVEGFEYVSWNPESQVKIAIDEVSTIWLSKTRVHKNLFLRNAM